jgi:hypothetical protein
MKLNMREMVRRDAMWSGRLPYYTASHPATVLPVELTLP